MTDFGQMPNISRSLFYVIGNPVGIPCDIKCASRNDAQLADMKILGKKTMHMDVR